MTVPRPRYVAAIAIGILGAVGAVVAGRARHDDSSVTMTDVGCYYAEGAIAIGGAAGVQLGGDLSATPPMCYDLPVGGWTPARPRCHETIVSIGPLVGDPYKDCR